MYDNSPQHIQWETATLMPAPRKGRPNQRETKYLVICQGCKNERWLSKCLANKSAINQACKSCSSRANGKKVYAKYGPHIQNKARDYRLQKPSSLEKLVMFALDDLGCEYDREIQYIWFNGKKWIDFKVSDGYYTFYIEADGHYWHDRLSNQESDKHLSEVMKSKGSHLLRVSDIQESGEAVNQEWVTYRVSSFINYLHEKVCMF